MRSRVLIKEDGFTLQETLVTLVVGSLLVSFCFSLYLSTSRLVSRWQARTEERAALHRAVQIFYRDVQRSRRTGDDSDSLIVLECGIGREVVYRIVGDTLWRNEVSLVEPTSAKLSADFTGVGNGITVRLMIEKDEFKVSMSSSPPWCSREFFECAMQRGNVRANSRRP